MMTWTIDTARADSPRTGGVEAAALAGAGMVALVSAKGSPGVTTSALALALAATGGCLLAECDPAGGDITPGYLRQPAPFRSGLVRLAHAVRDHQPSAEVPLVELDPPGRRRLLLAGVNNPTELITVAPRWEAIANRLHKCSRTGRQVIVDCGRLTDTDFGWPLIWHADRVLLVVRPTAASVAAAAHAARLLYEETFDDAKQALVIVGGDRRHHPQIADRIGLPIAAALPHDPRTATWLSCGGGRPRRRRPLLRAAAQLQHTLAG